MNLFKLFLYNLLQTLLVIGIVSYMNSSIVFSYTNVLKTSLVASTILTFCEYYDEDAKKTIRSAMLMSLGNQIY